MYSGENLVRLFWYTHFCPPPPPPLQYIPGAMYVLLGVVRRRNSAQRALSSVPNRGDQDCGVSFLGTRWSELCGTSLGGTAARPLDSDELWGPAPHPSSIRQYCMGDRGINFSVVSDQTTHFGGKFRRANYEDPNLNVAIPVFMIHGNHDDPTGAQHLSAVDLLSVCGLVNYFGKVEDFRSVDVSPILLEKVQGGWAERW